MIGKYSNIKEILFNNLLTIFLFILGLYFPFFIFLTVWNLFFYWQDNFNFFSIFFAIFMPTIVFYLLFGNYLVLMFIVLIFGLSLLIHKFFDKTKSFNKTFFTASIYLFVCGIIFILWFKYSQNRELSVYICDNIKDYFTINIYPYVSDEIKISLNQNFYYLKDFFYSIFILFTLSALAFSFKMAENYLLFKLPILKLNLQFNNLNIFPFPKFPKRFFINRFFRPNEYFIYALILNLFLILIFKSLPLNINKIVLLIFENLFVLFFSVYVLGGFLLVSYFFRYFKLPGFVIILFAFTLLFNPYIVLALGVVGIIDVFFNFRFSKNQGGSLV